MANIAPQSELRLFKDVKLDKGYKHGVFLGVGECTEAFIANQLMTNNHHLYTLTDYTYIRENSSVIRVKMRADDLWNVNYLCYKNPIMGTSKPNKWFFGFVDKTVYVNNEVTDIYFTEDILTTWWEEAQLSPCFVERMHEPNEDFGSNLVPEGLAVGDYKYALQPPGTIDNPTNIYLTVKQAVLNMRPTWTIVAVADETFEGGTIQNIYQQTPPRCYDDIVSGYRLFAWKTDEVQDPESDDCRNLMLFFDNHFNLYRTVDSTLLGVFVLPRQLLDESDVVWDWDIGSQTGIRYPNIKGHYDRTAVKDVDGYAINGDTTLDGYLPANLKMYTSPYCVCQFIQPDGQELILRHEYMMTRRTGAGFNFRIVTGMCCLYGIQPPYVLVFRPFEGYGCGPEISEPGVELYGSDPSNQIAYTSLPVGSWKNGIWQDVAKNIVAPMIVDLPFLVAGMSGALNAISTISPMTKTKEGMKSHVQGGLKTSYYETWKESQKTDYGTRESNNGYISAVHGVQRQLQNAFSQSMQPPIGKGRTDAGYASFAARVADFTTYCKCVNRDDAQRIDRYFSTFGYAQNKVMQPMRCVREKWTYLKTVDCLVHGNMPSELCYELSAIYNTGITFWRYLDDINEYNFNRGGNACLNNPII